MPRPDRTGPAHRAPLRLDKGLGELETWNEATMIDRGRRLAVSVANEAGRESATTEVILGVDDDFAHVMGLVRQAYEYQMDEG